MKPLFVVACFVLGGAFFGYLAGSSYCGHLLDIGAIYDEATWIPPEITDGSAYGKLWAAWGVPIGLGIGTLIQVWWRRGETPLGRTRASGLRVGARMFHAHKVAQRIVARPLACRE